MQSSQYKEERSYSWVTYYINCGILAFWMGRSRDGERKWEVKKGQNMAKRSRPKRAENIFLYQKFLPSFGNCVCVTYAFGGSPTIKFALVTIRCTL